MAQHPLKECTVVYLLPYLWQFNVPFLFSFFANYRWCFPEHLCVCVDPAGFLLKGFRWWWDSQARGRECGRQFVLFHQQHSGVWVSWCHCNVSSPQPW